MLNINHIIIIAIRSLTESSFSPIFALLQKSFLLHAMQGHFKRRLSDVIVRWMISVTGFYFECQLKPEKSGSGCDGGERSEKRN